MKLDQMQRVIHPKSSIIMLAVNGWRLRTDKYMDCYNPSTGDVIAQAPAVRRER